MSAEYKPGLKLTRKKRNIHAMFYSFIPAVLKSGHMQLCCTYYFN